MAIPHGETSDIVNMIPRVAAVDRSRITATLLLKTEVFEVIRLVVPAGKDTANHTTPGDLTVLCLDGAVEITAGDRTRRLTAGQMLYLALGTLHAMHGVEDAALLVTVMRCESRGRDDV